MSSFDTHTVGYSSLNHICALTLDVVQFGSFLLQFGLQRLGLGLQRRQSVAGLRGHLLRGHFHGKTQNPRRRGVFWRMEASGETDASLETERTDDAAAVTSWRMLNLARIRLKARERSHSDVRYILMMINIYTSTWACEIPGWKTRRSINTSLVLHGSKDVCQQYDLVRRHFRSRRIFDIIIYKIIEIWITKQI